jgi:GGDEF domain-containing protein
MSRLSENPVGPRPAAQAGSTTLPGATRAWAVLVFQGETLACVVPLPDHDLVVGRAYDCGLRIDDPAASRRHCTFRREAGAVLVEDAGSKNGTRVHGARVLRVALAEDDEVIVGSTILRLVDMNRPGRVIHPGIFEELYRDPATGLPNEGGFRIGAGLLLARALEGVPAALLRIRVLDHVGRTRGPDAGARFIREVAGWLGEMVHGASLVARVAEDELAILVPDCAPGALELLCPRLRRSLANLMSASCPGRRAHVAIGAVSFDGATHGFDRHEAAAREALLRARVAGQGLHIVRAIGGGT